MLSHLNACVCPLDALLGLPSIEPCVVRKFAAVELYDEAGPRQLVGEPDAEVLPTTYDSGDEGAAVPRQPLPHAKRITAQEIDLFSLPIFSLLRTTILEQEDNLGMTPLLAAVEGGHRDAATLLLIHGANVKATDSSGRKVNDIPRCPREILDSFSGLCDLNDGLAKSDGDLFAWEAPWSPELHWMWPASFREAVWTLLICSRHGRTYHGDTVRRTEASGMGGLYDSPASSPVTWLDDQSIRLIIRHMARPVGAWIRAEDVLAVGRDEQWLHEMTGHDDMFVNGYS